MLSDEERKKYEEIKYNNGYLYCDKEDVDCLIDIIEKQSKEIEENKKYIIQLTDEQYRKLVDIIRDETSKEWKDKIKAKIEEVSNGTYDAKIVMQSLLEKE